MSLMPSAMASFDSIAVHLLEMWPFVPMYIHLILAALFPIYAGAHASLSRPSSAAKPDKKQKQADEDYDEDEEEDEQPMEGLTPSDAIVLPVTAGIVLATLYWLIQRYGADLINLVLGYYFAGVGTISVAKLVNDGAELGLSFVFPTFFEDGGQLWKVDTEKRVARAQTGKTNAQERTSPLPGLLGRLGSQKSSCSLLWKTRAYSTQKYAVKLFVKGFADLKFSVTALNISSTLVGLAAVAYSVLVEKPWWLTNLQGFAVCYSALQFMSPTSFGTGSLILTGLFFYDIWAVFFTSLMVTVAKNLDQPIKLLFPRPDQADVPKSDRAFSMLGLGDIVLPGLMIGLALRFDLFMFYLRKQRKSTSDGDKGAEMSVEKASYTKVTGQSGSTFWTRRLPRDTLPVQLKDVRFPKPYFTASVLGYIIGMMATLGVMSIFQHAQPALLYLVPGVLISIWGTALLRGDLKEMWSFTEEVTAEAHDDDTKDNSNDSKKNDKDKARDEKQLGWFEWVKQEIFGLNGSAKQDKKIDDKTEKPTEQAKSKTNVDKDIIVDFSIKRRHALPSKSEANDSTSQLRSVSEKERQTPGMERAASQEASEDATAGPGDLDAVSEEGPLRKLRSMKGRVVSRSD